MAAYRVAMAAATPDASVWNRRRDGADPCQPFQSALSARAAFHEFNEAAIGSMGYGSGLVSHAEAMAKRRRINGVPLEEQIACREAAAHLWSRLVKTAGNPEVINGVPVECLLERIQAWDDAIAFESGALAPQRGPVPGATVTTPGTLLAAARSGAHPSTPASSLYVHAPVGSSIYSHHVIQARKGAARDVAYFARPSA
jgi:hypothetical protein